LAKIIDEFIGWLVERNHLTTEELLDFLIVDTGILLRGAQAQTVLRNSVGLQKRRNNWTDVHNVEPLYMVSRVKSGRLWFLRCGETPGHYQELGPVAVPLGASDLIKPGWCIQATFGLSDRQWRMVTVGRVLAV
jgi:hypothetical protein